MTIVRFSTSRSLIVQWGYRIFIGLSWRDLSASRMLIILLSSWKLNWNCQQLSSGSMLKFAKWSFTQGTSRQMGRQRRPDLAFSSIIGKFWIICIFLNTWTLSLFGFCPFRSPPLPFFLFILSLKDLLAWRGASNYLSWSKLSTGGKATPRAAHRCEHQCLRRVMQLKGKFDKVSYLTVAV